MKILFRLRQGDTYWVLEWETTIPDLIADARRWGKDADRPGHPMFGRTQDQRFSDCLGFIEAGCLNQLEPDALRYAHQIGSYFLWEGRKLIDVSFTENVVKLIITFVERVAQNDEETTYRIDIDYDVRQPGQTIEGLRRSFQV